MIDVKLVMRMYTKSLASQTWRQWWPHIQVTRRALF